MNVFIKRFANSPRGTALTNSGFILPKARTNPSIVKKFYGDRLPVWSRKQDCGSCNPGSNPGGRPTKLINRQSAYDLQVQGVQLSGGRLWSRPEVMLESTKPCTGKTDSGGVDV